MKAIVVENVDKVAVKEYEKPTILPYEVLYEVKAVSLCTVEQRVFKGTKKFGFPFLGGHENSGVVVEVGEAVTDFKVGDKVVSTFGYCGHCEYCIQGIGTQCRNSRKNRKRVDFEGMIVGGGMSQFMAVPQWQLVKLDDDAVFTESCLTEPLACCVHSVEKGNIKFGETVVVIGCGIMGYFHMKLAKLRGARVIVSEVDDARREKALKAGADFAVNPMAEDAVEFVKSKTNGVGANAVFNTISNPRVWPDAIAMLAPYGKLIAYSSQDNNDPVGISFGEMHNKEYEFIGTVSPTLEANYRASKLIGYKIIDVKEVTDSVYGYEDCEKAFNRACEPNTYRVVIKFD